MSHPPEDKRPLPEGWIKQFDSNNNAWFYVDTRANPPRSIWVHPLDDPEYQRTHKEKDAVPAYSGYTAPTGPPPRGSQSHPELGQHSKHAEKPQEKRGAFSKLKDKLIGTKEEREAERQAELARREQDRLRREQMMRERQQRIQQVRQSAPAGYYQQGPGGYYQQSPYGGYPQQQGGYYAQQQQQQGRSGFGGGGMGMGMGLPILGGLAGGMLLGGALDAGDGGFGGDDGGGDFGGGDGGGDFGGGGDF